MNKKFEDSFINSTKTRKPLFKFGANISIPESGQRSERNGNLQYRPITSV